MSTRPRFVFLAAWVFLAASLGTLMLMEERPLRTTTIPVEPVAPSGSVPAD